MDHQLRAMQRHAADILGAPFDRIQHPGLWKLLHAHRTTRVDIIAQFQIDSLGDRNVLCGLHRAIELVVAPVLCLLGGTLETIFPLVTMRSVAGETPGGKTLLGCIHLN